MTLTNNDAKEFRKDFPIFETNKNLAYLDNASTTQKPKAVITAITNFYETTNANIHRGVYTLSEKATNHYEDARKTVAQLINAQTDEIVFTQSTTDSLNMLAQSITALTGDRKEIVLTEMEHHSNLVPWQQLAQRTGMKLTFIQMKDDFTLDYEDAKNKITENTALVSVTHISNALGTVNDVQQLVQLAKDKGALSIIDAAQSMPHMKVDVQAIGCDFLVFSGHKMCGPTGVGVLFGKKDLLEKLPPSTFGGGMINKVTYETTTWADNPQKFEAGTPNIAGVIGLAAAITYLQKIGMENITTWEKELTEYALEKIRALPNIKLYTSENSAGIISFTIEGIHPHDTAAIANDEGVCIRGGHHCCMPLMDKLGVAGTSRASFYFYNTKEDADTFINALEKAQDIFNSAKNGA